MRHWARRVELAHRAGFESLDAVESPTPKLESLALALLAQTDELYSQLVPTDLEGFFETALASSALSGWPSKLHFRGVEQLLGTREWLHGLSPRVGRLPIALSPASYYRALNEVGKSLVDAAPSGVQPFVVARDPNGLFRQTLGALLGQLPQSVTFNVRNRKLSRHEAQAQARLATLSGLIHCRSSALSSLLRAQLGRSEAEFLSEFEALTHRTYGFALPRALAGLWPQLRPDGGQQFLGMSLASQLEESLIAEHDEDWFRNPRGIESVRAQLCEVPEPTVTEEKAESAMSCFVAKLSARLA